jgi:GNAT superfamily N-acetyltransferase
VQEELQLQLAGVDDAPALAETVREGFESYREWAPPDWRPPDHRLELRNIRERLGRPDAWCLMASDGAGTPAGHVAFLAAAEREPPHHAIPGRAHLWMLFLRRPWWGTGLAARLLTLATEEAARQGYADMRLFTPVGAARARAFYEREGWRAVGDTWLEPFLELELIEYRRPL